jgi:serine/threonine protein phosphatase PrpC
MGCCGSHPEVALPAPIKGEHAAPDAAGSDASRVSGHKDEASRASGHAASVDSSSRRISSTPKNMLHTNSMLFSSEVIEEAKRSVRMARPPVGEGEIALAVESKASDEAAPDPHGLLVASRNGYELGQEIVYGKEMTETFKIAQVLRGGERRELKFGYTTLQGRSAGGPVGRGTLGPAKPNQDSLCCFRLEGHSNIAVFGVFDGHGPFGQFAAHFCRMRLHVELKKALAEQLRPAYEEALQTACQRIHREFNLTDVKRSGVDPQVSGTTLIVAMVVDDRIIVANVGDSRCIMGTQRAGVSDGKPVVEPLSDDHKPERESEAKRIAKTEAVLLSEGQLRGGPRDGKTYVCRKDKLGSIVYGVLFSRSIGDLDAHTYLGIESTAEFMEAKVDRPEPPNQAQYLVLASDGLWDQVTNEEVLKVVFQYKDPLRASEELTAIARNLWDNDRLNSRRDDITVCVVQLL